MTRQRSAVLAALLALVVSVAALAAASTRASAAGKPIILGFVVDLSGNMSPFDAPALAAAQLEVAAINKKGGVDGRPLQIQVCNTQLNAAKAKSCAASMLDKGAAALVVTCDVDYATPATQEALNRGVLAVAPCIGTDQMGPKRFGSKGKLAFSFGNVAQDEGAAMAEFAYNRKHWKTAVIVTNNQLVYFKNTTAAFEKRFTQLGGKVVGHESYTTGDNTIQNVISRVSGEKSDALVTSTTFGELPALVQGLRALHDDRAILNSWAGDGNYWFPKGMAISNYYDLTYASVFGDDPNAAVKAMIAKLKAEGRPRRPAASWPARRPSTASSRRSRRPVARPRRQARGRDAGLQGVKTISATSRSRPPCTPCSGGPTGSCRSRTESRTTSARSRRPAPRRSKRGVDAVESARHGGPGRRSGPPASSAPTRAPRRSPRSRSSSARRGRRADRAERRGQEHAGQRALRVQPAVCRPGRAGRRRHHPLGAGPAGRAGIARTFQHAHAFRGLSVRENVEVAALGVGASTRAARERAGELLAVLQLDRFADARRSPCRTATSGGSASPGRWPPSRRSCCSTSLRRACPSPSCRRSPRSSAR